MGATIPVVFVTDNDFLAPTYVAILSLIRTHTDSRPLELYLLVPPDYSDTNRQVLKSLTEREGIPTPRFVDVGDAYAQTRRPYAHISQTAMYRLLIPQILDSCDRCIYLDADLVLRDDVAELYDVELGSNCVAGVLDLGFQYNADKHKHTIGIPSMDTYVNSGVLLFNLQEIRRRGLAGELARAGHTVVGDYCFSDQDAINVTLYGMVYVLPLRFNVMFLPPSDDASAYRSFLDSIYGRERIEEARCAPLVEHYVGREKPWKDPEMPRAGLWWHYVDLIDNETRQALIDPFVRSHRDGLGTKVFLAIKATLMKLDIYQPVRNALIRWGYLG